MTSHSFRFFGLTAAVCSFSFSLVSAGVWDGGGADGNTGTALNWVGDEVPAQTGASVTFGGNLQTSVNNDWLEQVTGITFASGASPFTLSGDGITLAGGILNNSSVTQTIALNIHVSGSGTGRFVRGIGGVETQLSGNISGTELWLYRESGSGSAIMTLSGNNTLSGQIVVGSSTHFNIASATAAGNGASIRLNASTASFDNTSGGALTINNTLDLRNLAEFVGTHALTMTGGLDLRSGSGSFTVGGSSLTIENSFTNNNVSHTMGKNGSGALIFASNVVTDPNWVGGFNVSQGSLFIHSNMSANTGSLSVSSGTVFGGAGSYGGAAAISGSLRPGDGIGTLTIGNAVTWNGSVGNAWVFELGAGNAADLLAITGASGQFLKGTGDSFVFDFGGAGFVGNFTLIDWSSEDDLGGGALGTTFDLADFSYINLAEDYEGTFFFDGTSLNIAVIPEPAAMAGAFAAIALLVVALRRRRG